MGRNPPPSSELVSRRMRNTRSRDTPPELAIRRLLHARGLRYRVDARPVKGLNRKADIVFGPSRVAVFVDGCFWHACPEHGSAPKANAAWWAEKLRKNIERDRDTDAQLVAAGWTVLRIWEHEPPEMAAALIVATVVERRSRSLRTAGARPSPDMQPAPFLVDGRAFRASNTGQARPSLG